MLSEVIYIFKDADVITSLCLMTPWDTGIKTHSSHRDSFPLVAWHKKKYWIYIADCTCNGTIKQTVINTLTHKGASRCHRITFLSKRFHKEPLTSEEPFCFTKGSLWWKGSSDYKTVRKRWFFKEPLTEWFFVEPKMVILWHRLKKHLYF